MEIYAYYPSGGPTFPETKVRYAACFFRPVRVFKPCPENVSGWEERGSLFLRKEAASLVSGRLSRKEGSPSRKGFPLSRSLRQSAILHTEPSPEDGHHAQTGPSGIFFSNGRAAPCPPRKTEKRPPQKPNGATAVRRSSAAASHGWRTDIPAHRHDCGTHSWPGARCHGRRRRVPAPCRRNRR